MKVRWALGLYAAGLCLLVALGGWSSSRSTELVSGGGALEDASGAKASMLRSDLSALEGATAAEARAAARERKVGSAKLQLARQASHDATSFMRKAQTLLTSEEALKQQQVDVKRELGEIEAEHRNIRQWAQCADGGDCEKGSQQDLWERRGGGGHQEISSQGSTEVAPRAVSVGGQALASHAPEIERKPYSASEWTDTKPAVSWEHSKPLAIEAGYELSNCMVAAEKDTGVVEVKLIEKVPAIMTEQGCTCKMPWHLHRDEKDGSDRVESRNLRTYDRCTEKGSKGHPWCAVDGDACGRKSDDLHVGSQDDQYGWSHWDFCDPSKKGGWTHKVLWKAKHSAGQVTCLAEFLITSDKATEWRALDLLQQQVVDKTDGRQAPAQIASVYEQCVRNAQDSASVVFCETDMLAHFPQSLVRHALLISRANSIRVHWANRQRVYLLYTLQFQKCMNKAKGKREGEVCLSQLLSSMPEELSKVAVSHALDSPKSGGAPRSVPELSSRMVACMQAAADKDAAAFCVATFLAHAPHQTVREAAAMGKRVRDFGSAGFPNVHGGSGVTSGWVGFQDGVQSHNTHIWKQ